MSPSATIPNSPGEPGAIPADAAYVPPPVRPRRRKRILFSLAALLLAAGASLMLALSMTRMTPRWWMEIDAASPAIVATAQRVENGAATQLTRIRRLEPGAPASEPWTIKISAADANAWLAARLRPWLESQENAQFTWPKDLQRVQVAFEGGRIVIGASVLRKGIGSGARLEAPAPDFVGPLLPSEAGPEPAGSTAQIVAASLHPELRPDGGLWLPATSVSIGRLSVPPSWLLPRAKPQSPGKVTRRKASPEAIASAEALTKLPQMRDVIAALEGERPAMELPIIRIGDGRRVRILELRPEGGELYITCQTLPRETTRAGK